MIHRRQNPLRPALKALARLLHYPDEALVESIEALAEILRARPELAPGERASLAGLAARFREHSLLDLQADYVDTFDRGRMVSLHLFEHVYGESRARGPAMVELASAYREQGLEIGCRELPDYLPLLLEFCAELDEDETRAWLEEIGHVLQKLHVRLALRVSPYAVTLRLLLCIAGLDPEPQDLVREAAGEARDDTPEALDRIWIEAPVTFGPDPSVSGCGASGRERELPVEWTHHPQAGARSGGRS